LFGPEIDHPVTYPIHDPEKVNDTISGEVIFTDNFGNCITNIPDSLISSYDYGTLFKIKGSSFSFFASYGSNYASVPENQNVMLVDRLNRLEMAVNLGNLSQRYPLNAGSAIKLFLSKVHIGILQFNNTTSPFVDTLKNVLSANGFNEAGNTVIAERNADGNSEQFSTLIQELIGEKIDILISFSTPATQAAVTMTPDSIPIVFSLVTDPESAGVLNQRPRVTGLSDATDCFQFISFARRLMPELTIAGSIYDSQEANSVYIQQKLHNQLLFLGINYFNAAVTAVEDIPSAYQVIKAHNIEVILITNDNTMTLGTAALVALATPDAIPVLGTDYNNARNGALAAIGVDYDLIARETGILAIAIIRGVNPDEVPVHYFETNTISLNTQTAANLGYVFDPGLLEEAKYVFP
jgi:putative ABC transport system substrate-binding protein